MQREIDAVALESEGRIKLQVFENRIDLHDGRLAQLEAWRGAVETAEAQAVRARLAELQERERKRVEAIAKAEDEEATATRARLATEATEKDRRRHELRRSIILSFVTCVLGVIGALITSWLIRR